MVVNIIELAKFSDSQKEKLSYVLGALFGDGCFYTKKGGRIHFGCCDTDFIEAVAKSIQSLFDVKIIIRRRMLSLKNPEWKNFYYLSSRPLFRKLKEFSDKKIPDFIRNSSINIKASFIKGFFDAEGNVSIHTIKSRNELQRHVRCFSNDLELLKGISAFLKDLGIKSFIGKSKGKNYCITIWNYNSLINYKNSIGFNIKRKMLLLEKAISSYKEIQVQWDKSVYENVMRMRQEENIGAEKIKQKLSNLGLTIPKPTIEAWIYGKIRGDKMIDSKGRQNSDENIIFIGKN